MTQAPFANREALDDGARVDLEIEMERHQPNLSMEDGSIHGCQCMDRVFYRKHESWGSHLADVALAAVLSVQPVEGEVEHTDFESASEAMSALGDPLDPMPQRWTVVVDKHGPVSTLGKWAAPFPTPDELEHYRDAQRNGWIR